MSKTKTVTSAVLALLLAASGSAMAAGEGGGTGAGGGAGGSAGGGGNYGSAQNAPAGNDTAASGTQAHKPMMHKSSSKMHKSTKKPMNDQSNAPGADTSSDAKGQ